MNHLRMLLLSAALVALPALATTAHADLLYASTDPTNTFGDFGTLDPSDGVFTVLGDNGVALAGIGTENGILYGMARNTASGTLYSINTANGALTSIGNSNISILDFGVTSTGLWAIGTDDNLYQINAATGAATLIGAVTPTVTPPSVQNWNSLASGVSSLLLGLLDNFYSLDPNSGAATFLGCGGSFPFGGCSGPQMGAMGELDGVLYGVDNPTFGLYSVNTANGATNIAHFLIDITGNSGAFNGLSAAPTTVVHGVPEPITLTLFGAGLASAAAIRRRKKVGA